MLEQSQASLEQQVSKPSCSPSSAPIVKGPKKRKRQTPVALQVSAIVTVMDCMHTTSPCHYYACMPNTG